MNAEYNELPVDELTPGTLCTVLGARRKKRKYVPGVSEYPMPGVVMMEQSEPVPFQGYPLQVLHSERGNPYIVCKVMQKTRPGEEPNKTILDTRRIRFCRLSSEYVRCALGMEFETSLR